MSLLPAFETDVQIKLLFVITWKSFHIIHSLFTPQHPHSGIHVVMPGNTDFLVGFIYLFFCSCIVFVCLFVCFYARMRSCYTVKNLSWQETSQHIVRQTTLCLEGNYTHTKKHKTTNLDHLNLQAAK